MMLSALEKGMMRGLFHKHLIALILSFRQHAVSCIFGTGIIYRSVITFHAIFLSSFPRIKLYPSLIYFIIFA